MKTMVVSELKAKCTAVLREAQRSGEPILVTRHGRPIARIEPIAGPGAERRLGVHRGRMKIKGDIVHTGTEDDWEMLR